MTGMTVAGAEPGHQRSGSARRPPSAKRPFTRAWDCRIPFRKTGYPALRASIPVFTCLHYTHSPRFVKRVFIFLFIFTTVAFRRPLPPPTGSPGRVPTAGRPPPFGGTPLRPCMGLPNPLSPNGLPCAPRLYSRYSVLFPIPLPLRGR